MVHQRAEDQRRDRLADVQPGIDHAVDTSGRIRRRRALDDQVARRPGDSGTEAHHAEQHRHRHRRQVAKPDRQRDQRGDAEARADDMLAARRIGDQESSGDHAAGAAHHVDRQAHRREVDRHLVQQTCRTGREGLHAAERHREKEEEREAHPDRGNLQEREAAFGRRGTGVRHGTLAGDHGIEREVRTVQHQQREHRERQQPGAHQRHPPRPGDRQRHQHRRGQRPTQVAGDAVHAERMAQPGRLYLAVQQRVVHRMEHAIADARDHRPQRQQRVARAGREPERRGAEQGEPGEQHRTRPEAIDRKTRGGLHHARDDEEDRHQQAELGVADIEGLLQPRKQRCQQELAEMADQVRQADETDQVGILSGRPRRGGESRHGLGLA